MSGFTSECVYLDNTSKMRLLFIHASHKQRNYNNYTSMVTSQPSAGKPITASQVLIIFKHYGIQTGKTVQFGDIQQSQGWQNWMRNQDDENSVTIAPGLNIQVGQISINLKLKNIYFGRLNPQ